MHTVWSSGQAFGEHDDHNSGYMHHHEFCVVRKYHQKYRKLHAPRPPPLAPRHKVEVFQMTKKFDFVKYTVFEKYF